MYYEKFKAGKLAMVVRREDADPGVAGVEIVPVDADHISICKPKNRTYPVYVGVRAHIADLINETKNQIPVGVIAPGGAPASHQPEAAKIENLKDWLKGDSGGADIAASASLARKNALKGRWEGTQKQESGPTGQPIEYYIACLIDWDGNAAVGTFQYRYRKDDVTLADETVQFRGNFTHDRFLKLNYEDTVSGKLQFGYLLLELSDDGQTLQGVDLGYGYTTKKIMAASNLLHKQKGPP